MVFKNQVNGTVTAEIYSISGKLVYKTNKNVSDANTIEINTDFQLMSGVYLLKVTNDTTVFNAKIIIE